MVVLSLQCGENTAFFSGFPLAGFTNKAFFRLSLWIFKEKALIIFSNTAFPKTDTASFPDGSDAVSAVFPSPPLQKF